MGHLLEGIAMHGLEEIVVITQAQQNVLIGLHKSGTMYRGEILEGGAKIKWTKIQEDIPKEDLQVHG
jgi:hypothetical protein